MTKSLKSANCRQWTRKLSKRPNLWKEDRQIRSFVWSGQVSSREDKRTNSCYEAQVEKLKIESYLCKAQEIIQEAELD